METSIISAALFIVMILLLLVIYDSNATLQEIVRKIRKSHGKDAGESHPEVTMSNEPIAGIISQQVPEVESRPPIVNPVDQQILVQADQPLAMAVDATPPTLIENQQNQLQQVVGQQTQATGYQEPISAPSDSLDQAANNPVGVKEWYIGVFRKLLKKDGKKVETVKISEPIPVQNQASSQEAMAPIINALQSTIADLTNRVMQAETAIGKIEKIEGDITNATEATEMVSEEMRDILGTIRVSIDGLDSRLNQAGSEIQNLQEIKASKQDIQIASPTEGSADEETKLNIKRLQEAVADMTDTIEAMPEEIRTALTNSQSAITASQEQNERLEIIWDNLQATPGFGAQKTFRCESCGTHGYIASQVSCSKCGTSTWFGWWPPYEEMQEMEANRSQAVSDNEEIAEMADMFGAGDNSEEVADISDLPDIDANPEVPDISELAKMIEAADIIDVPEETDSEELEDVQEMTEAIDSIDTEEVENKPDEKAKPKKKVKKAKKK